MRTLIPAVALLVLGGRVGADEPTPPKVASAPATALARAERDGPRIVITLRVLDTATETRKQSVVVMMPVKKVQDGKEVTELVPFAQDSIVGVTVVKGFREVKLLGRDVKVQDTAGKKVLTGKLPDLLAKETPVLLSTAEQVDAFYLLTAREGTLILTVDAQKLSPPMTPPGTGPGN
jgi:hypothetical protein